MRDSLVILLVFALGAALGRGEVLALPQGADAALPALWVFMLLAGLCVGSDPKLPQILKSISGYMLLLPLATTVGTFAGCALIACVLPLGLADCLAAGAGFGYYSLSSIFISQLRGVDLGAVALLCNVLRELFTLVAMPLLVRCFGPLAAIGCGGATSMDTTLPVIVRYAGPQFIFPAVIHAMILDLSVPFWVSLFCALASS